jgi:hypothetical protein
LAEDAQDLQISRALVDRAVQVEAVEQLQVQVVLQQ